MLGYLGWKRQKGQARDTHIWRLDNYVPNIRLLHQILIGLDKYLIERKQWQL